ncbi:MAG TPA: hypothetical protein VGK02_08670 [Candidatus Aquicultor sp.]
MERLKQWAEKGIDRLGIVLFGGDSQAVALGNVALGKRLSLSDRMLLAQYCKLQRMFERETDQMRKDIIVDDLVEIEMELRKRSILGDIHD